ncbi:hypothetical protein GA0115252_142335, partial [Streptomyces sp. DfronAA-171]
TTCAPGRPGEGRRRVGAGVGDDHDPHARPDGQRRVPGGAAQGGEGVREQRLLVVGGDDDREGGQLARGTRDVQAGLPYGKGAPSGTGVPYEAGGSNGPYSPGVPGRPPSGGLMLTRVLRTRPGTARAVRPACGG